MSPAAAPTEPAGPVVDEHGVVFALVDNYRRLASVRLEQEIGLNGLAFTRPGRGGPPLWHLRIPRPPVDRMEYLFDVEDDNGRRVTITDPANPRRVGGAFGDKSVLEFPGYVAPAWLGTAAPSGTLRDFAVAAPLLDSEVTGAVWTADGLADDTTSAPLLVVHDGPEFANLGGFTDYLAALVATGDLPPLRAVLLSPGERNAWYSANAAYAATLAECVLPALPPATVRIGVGVSLGALAMLHVHCSAPGALDALFLQSGSFFTADLDAQETAFSGFAAVTAFVAGLHAGAAEVPAVPTTLTCGVAEENLANNQRMARTLTRLGFAATLHTVRDAHNYTAWRDALHPRLTDLVSRTVAGHAP